MHVWYTRSTEEEIGTWAIRDITFGSLGFCLGWLWRHVALVTGRCVILVELEITLATQDQEPYLALAALDDVCFADKGPNKNILK